MHRHREWLLREIGKVERDRTTSPWWREGGAFLFRGELMRLEVAGLDCVPHLRLGAELFAAPSATRESDSALRAWVESHLRKLARIELPRRVFELAARHSSPVRRISVRNQRSRWGSCSRHGTISLNWRLLQSPIDVRDYVIVHELMHLREMNHSTRFWKLVAEACPGYRACEGWLRQHGRALR
jgi:predicted metal-dependent hydrolase